MHVARTSGSDQLISLSVCVSKEYGPADDQHGQWTHSDRVLVVRKTSSDAITDAGSFALSDDSS